MLLPRNQSKTFSTKPVNYILALISRKKITVVLLTAKHFMSAGWVDRESESFGELEDRRSIDACALGVAHFYTRSIVRASIRDYHFRSA